MHMCTLMHTGTHIHTLFIDKVAIDSEVRNTDFIDLINLFAEVHWQ